MAFEQFTMDAYPVHRRPAAWSDALQPHHWRPFVHQHAELLHGTLTARRSERGVALARIAASPQRLQRVGPQDDAVWVALHMAGDATLLDGPRRFDVAPGDIVYGPSGASPGLEFRSSFRQFVVSLPRRAVETRLSAAPRVAVGRLSGSAGMGRMFAGTLAALSDAFEALSADDLAAVEISLAEFVGSSLARPEQDGPGGLGSTQAATLRRALQFIEANLADPDLCLGAIAQRERVSERLLQKLFEASGQTFSGRVRQRRLERCRGDLANRQYAHLSVSDICFRWGFNDAAHFSRAFRSAYGFSPTQYRQECAGATEPSLHRRVQRGWPAGYSEPAPQAAAQRGGAPAQAAADVAASECVAATSAQQHWLAANDQTVHWGYFSRNIPPVLRVNPGDVVTIETLTQHAYDDYERMIKGDSGAESVFHWTPERKNVDRRGAGPVDASVYGRGSGEGFGVHICTGPVYVRGAEPGDVLEVRILDLMPRLTANTRYQGRAFGSNAAAWWGFHYEDLIEDPKPREVITIYEVDCRDGAGCAHAVYNYRWTPQRDPFGVLHPTIDYPGVPVDRSTIVENHDVLRGVRIPVRPHFGVIAVAPVETGVVDSVPPAYFGGNIDNWRMGKGAAVYLRVGVEGALLSVGDPHASQGDSELCGTAIECSLTGTFQVLLHKAADLPGCAYADIDYPLIETADEWVLHGFSHPNYLQEFGDKARSAIYDKSSLDLAMRDAFRKTRRFLMTAKGLSEDEALSLMSVAVDFGVTQVVDGNWGVHAVIRKSLFPS